MPAHPRCGQRSVGSELFGSAGQLLLVATCKRPAERERRPGRVLDRGPGWRVERTLAARRARTGRVDHSGARLSPLLVSLLLVACEPKHDAVLAVDVRAPGVRTSLVELRVELAGAGSRDLAYRMPGGEPLELDPARRLVVTFDGQRLGPVAVLASATDQTSGLRWRACGSTQLVRNRVVTLSLHLGEEAPGCPGSASDGGAPDGPTGPHDGGANGSDALAPSDARAAADAPAGPDGGADAGARPDRWTALPAAGLEARADHTAVWTGTEMIIWGGLGAAPLATGGRYDPSRGAWMPTSTEGAPAARSGHTAVWTGSEMIVWGGLTPETVHTGGRYDPVLDRWTPTNAARGSGHPSKRFAHSAVWTGTEMIIWGGLDGGVRADGARYDPGLDAWMPVASDGAPSGRSRHGAVWSGSEMLLWGGQDPPTYFADGASYDPISNAWAPLPTVGAPTARALPGAVWTGSELVVWGGLGATAALAEGARFGGVPATWSAMSSVGEPEARSEHTAIASNLHVLFWGGLGQAALGTGGAYSLAEDRWTALPAEGAPSARTRHTAVGTGAQMIIWGGHDGTQALADGAALTPP